MFFPIRTDSPIRRRPTVNHLVIALNAVVFLWTGGLAGGAGQGESLKNQFALDPQALQVLQFFTYQFLHGDFWHLFGNMLFLWVFGNSVNSKMGQLSYLMFYLAGGVFAGVAFCLTTDSPCIGASGAIAAVTTAYLVLFPRSEVTVFYWLFFYVGTMRIGALTLIVAKVILWDNVISPRLVMGGAESQVAYSAHIAGYAFGLIVAGGLLLIRALPRDQYDIVALARRAYQRQQFRQLMSDPNVRAQATLGRVARPVSSTDGRPIEPADADDEFVPLRRQISDCLLDHRYEEAASAYLELMARNPNEIIPQRSLLAIANQLMVSGSYQQAAAAYGRFLDAYPGDSQVPQVKLVLGILYAKYLNLPGSARPYLEECAGGLTNPDLQRQARDWLEVVSTALRRGPSTA